MTSSQVKANEQDSASTNSAEVQDAVEDGADADKVGRLAGFLQSQKDEFVADLKEGKGKGWIVVMGNEAGGELYISAQAYAQTSTLLHLLSPMLNSPPLSSVSVSYPLSSHHLHSCPSDPKISWHSRTPISLYLRYSTSTPSLSLLRTSRVKASVSPLSTIISCYRCLVRYLQDSYKGLSITMTMKKLMKTRRSGWSRYRLAVPRAWLPSISCLNGRHRYLVQQDQAVHPSPLN